VWAAILAPRWGWTTATDHGSLRRLLSGYLMKVCHTGNPVALTVGFPFPTGA
jgi:hypothetical protein